MAAFRRHDLPPCPPGHRVGLLGGSFDPPHEGHAHITRCAFRALGLDAVWWLFANANPLKRHPPAMPEARIAAAKGLLVHPRVHLSDLEPRMGFNRTADTIAFLQCRFPEAKFVWLTGTDALAEMHRWQRWRQIFERLPICALMRPNCRGAVFHSAAARRYARARIRPEESESLALRPAPAWTVLTVPLREASSTAIRHRDAGCAG